MTTEYRFAEYGEFDLDAVVELHGTLFEAACLDCGDRVPMTAMLARLDAGEPDPACAPLNHIMGETREASFRIGMNNNFAFGGVNTSLIFGRNGSGRR